MAEMSACKRCRKMKVFDKDQFREDMKPILDGQDIEILIHLYEARRCKAPAEEVSKILGLTAGRVKHRILKTVDYLRRLAGYAVLFERAVEGLDSEPENPKAN